MAKCLRAVATLAEDLRLALSTHHITDDKHPQLQFQRDLTPSGGTRHKTFTHININTSFKNNKDDFMKLRSFSFSKHVYLF